MEAISEANRILLHREAISMKLFRALRSGNMAELSNLLDEIVNPAVSTEERDMILNWPNPKGESLLMVAITSGTTESVNLLLDKAGHAMNLNFIDNKV
mgnify:FL=1